MIHTTKAQSHWNYFLAVERDLDILSRYVDLDSDNFKCYSLEIGRILLSAAAEVDVVCKQLYQNKTGQSGGIETHRKQITKRFPGLQSFDVEIPQFGLRLTPWENWQSSKVPGWWTAHNKVKHQRDSHYAQANLFNALNATAALFVAALYLYRDKSRSGELLPNPKLLRVADRHVQSINGETGAPDINLE
jgi:hypothetical protein